MAEVMLYKGKCVHLRLRQTRIYNQFLLFITCLTLGKWLSLLASGSLCKMEMMTKMTTGIYPSVCQNFKHVRDNLLRLVPLFCPHR